MKHLVFSQTLRQFLLVTTAGGQAALFATWARGHRSFRRAGDSPSAGRLVGGSVGIWTWVWLANTTLVLLVKGWLTHFRPGWNPAQLIAVHRICLRPSCLWSIASCFLQVREETKGLHGWDLRCVVWTVGASQWAGKGLSECWVAEPGSSDLGRKTVQVL